MRNTEKRKGSGAPVLYRQGDVLLVAVDSAPPGDWIEVPRDGGRVVLAYGEVTAHSHAIASRSATLKRRKDTEAEARGLVADALLEARRAVLLRHEEHDQIRLPAGKYIVRIQRSYSPEAIRSVVD